MVCAQEVYMLFAIKFLISVYVRKCDCFKKYCSSFPFPCLALPCLALPFRGIKLISGKYQTYLG